MTRWVLVALAALAACEPSDRGPRWRPAGASAPQRGGTLRFAIKEGVATLDPTIAYDEASFYAMRPLYETLIDFAPGEVTLVPRLADRWEISSDATTFTFWLRPGVAFGDGTPIRTGDVKYGLERALRTADSPYAALLRDVVGAQDVLDGKAVDCAGITVPNDRELVIRLGRPSAGFLYVMAMMFTTPQRASHVIAAGDQLRRTPLSTGAYELAAWSEGERLVLRRNQHYRGTQPAYLEEIVLLENIARDTQFLMFERGELESARLLAAPDHLWLVAQEAWRPYVFSQALMSSYGVRFDVTQKPFDDKRVRKALNYALNKEHTTKLLTGTSVPAHGLLAPGAYGRDPSIVPYPHDPAKARQLLAEAGFSDGLTVEFVTIADEEAEKLAVAMQHDFAEVGVTIQIQIVSFANYVALIGKPGGPRLAYTGWIGDSPDPTSYFDPKFHSSAITAEHSTNDSFYKNPEVDALLDRARGEVDAAKRAELYQQVERILFDDAPWLWNYHQVVVEVTQPYLRDYAPHPVLLRDYSLAWLDLGPDGTPVPR